MRTRMEESIIEVVGSVQIRVEKIGNSNLH